MVTAVLCVVVAVVIIDDNKSDSVGCDDCVTILPVPTERSKSLVGRSFNPFFLNLFFLFFLYFAIYSTNFFDTLQRNKSPYLFMLSSFVGDAYGFSYRKCTYTYTSII